MKERIKECLQPLRALTKALKPKQKSDLRGLVNAGQAKTHRECAQHFRRRRSAQFLCEIELFVQSRAPFDLPKVLRTRQFFTIFM